MTPIEITFDWKDVNQAAAAKALARNAQPPMWQTLALLVGGALLAYLFDTFVVGSNGTGGVWGFGIGVYACIAWNWLRFRITAKGIANSPTRASTMTLSLDQDGYSAKTELSHGWTAWSTVKAIKPTKDMIVVAVGTVEYFPILDSALPDGMTRDDMIKTLEQLTGLQAG
jgi:hypothetical protein